MPSSGDVPEKWYKRFLCEINLDAVQSDAGLLQIAYSPRLQEKNQAILISGYTWQCNKNAYVASFLLEE